MTSIVIQAGATGGVIIVSCVFTAAFYYTIRWLNQIHNIEHSVEPDKRRYVKPLGTAVEMRMAHVRYHHYPRAPSDPTHRHDNNTRLPSDSQFGDDEMDIPFLVMAPDDVTDGNSEDAVYLLDHIGGEMMRPFSTKKLQQMTRPLIVILFLSSVSFLLGLMACELIGFKIRIYFCLSLFQ